MGDEENIHDGAGGSKRPNNSAELPNVEPESVTAKVDQVSVPSGSFSRNVETVSSARLPRSQRVAPTHIPRVKGSNLKGIDPLEKSVPSGSFPRTDETVSSARLPRSQRVVPTALSERMPRAKGPNFKAVIDPYEKVFMSKDKLHLGTGLVFHVSMGDPDCLWDSGYPECPARFFTVIHRCSELGLLQRCMRIDARLATREELLRVHSEAHVDLLKKYDGVDDAVVLENLSSNYDAIFVHPTTYSVALLAAGSAINLVDAICSKKVTNGIAIIRPPGHHAMHAEFNGYCFFNNVALAAQHAIEVHKLQKILIVDWDVHHGQGTQQMFYDDKRVLYFSIHRFEDGSFWPNLAESDLNYVGSGHGKGFNVNVPLNKIGMGNSEYMAIFQKILLPIAYEFQPNLILVSAGYDAAIGCPEGEMEVTPAGYAHLLWSLKGLAEGNIAVILEGGYCLQSLDEGVALTLRSLLGDPCPMMESLGEPDQSIKDTILQCIGHHYPFWKCFQNDHKVGLEASGESSEAPIWPYPRPLRLRSNVGPFATRNCYPVVSPDRKALYEARINNLIEETQLTFAPSRVCYAYELEETSFADKSLELESECPARITHTHKVLEEFGIVARCKRLTITTAHVSSILLVHSSKYLSMLSSTRALGPDELLLLQDNYVSVVFKKSTFPSVMVAVGCLIEVVNDVCSGKSQTGVAVIRPPGHHAEPDIASGFCMVNNVAIAARHAQHVHKVKKILIVDWDVHHGNGTQQIFYDDASVLYISVHRYDNGRFFPGTKDGNCDKVGAGNGLGFNVNIPWESAGMHDGDYVAAFTKVILPVAYEFKPDLVIISAGFDAAINDPIGRCCVTPEAYSHFTHWLAPLANGRLIIALEGGYNIHSVSSCMASCMKALLGDPLPDLDNVKPSCGGLKSVFETINAQSRYWGSLRIKNSGENTRQIVQGTHMSALHQFGKEYDELTPTKQLECFKILVNPETLAANTVISQFHDLSVHSKRH